MVRKWQILFQLLGVLVDGLLPAIVHASLFGVSTTTVLIAFVVPTSKLILRKYHFEEHENLLKQFLESTLFTLIITGVLSFFEESLTSFASLLLLSFLLVNLALFGLDRLMYLIFPGKKVRVLFAGQAALGESFMKELARRGLAHRYTCVGYIDYKGGSDKLNFLGKFIDAKAVLHDHKPHVVINCERQEQHTTLHHLATLLGIYYAGIPTHVSIKGVAGAVKQPFGLPINEYSVSKMTYWSYLHKRAFDIAIAAVLIASRPVQTLFQEKRAIAVKDMRHGKKTSLKTGVANSAPLLIEVLKNRMSLVGPSLETKLSHHLDLKYGIFSPDTVHDDEEATFLHYLHHWSLFGDLNIVLKNLNRLRS
jgi:hypothetical protein